MSPQRTCIACRRVDDQAAMVRLVRQETGVVDGTLPRLPGRGAYLHAGCLQVAERRQAIRRAFGPGAELTAEARVAISSSGSAAHGAL